MNLFTLVSQTKIFLYWVGKLSMKVVLSLVSRRSLHSLFDEINGLVVLVLHVTAYFPSLNVPYVFFWFCLISVSVIDVENWMPYARNNHGKAKSRGYVMSLFMQLKPACLPFCFYCCTNRPYCLIDHNKSYVLSSCRMNTIYIGHSWAYTLYLCLSMYAQFAWDKAVKMSRPQKWILLFATLPICVFYSVRVKICIFFNG